MTSPIAERVTAFFSMDQAALRAAYRELFGEEPRCRSRTWLAKNCAWKLQHAAQPEPPPPRRVSPLRPGVTLTRVWHGVEHRVQVLDDGYAWQGRPYRSLSAVAKAITGQHWSGALFFGLRGRRKKKP
ncbi:MAG TPA: DUF2924 domain-containing protein [Planctomycetota bacterium]|nr:DUF2924 domain-containing protein [Planctomycetota bacterium]